MPLVLNGPGSVRQHVGEHLGYSDWHEVTQEQVNLFAEATGDHQWIHVDVARSAAGPFGGTIAHGYLTMSMGPMLAPSVYRVEGAKMALNYGCDRIRFPRTVLVGSRVRLGVDLLGAEPVGGTDSVLQISVRFTVEHEDGGKPACVANILFRYSW